MEIVRRLLSLGSRGDARKIPSTTLRAGSSGLKSLRMTPGLKEGDTGFERRGSE